MIYRLINWINDNQGVVSILIFLMTLFLGWFSGIFAALRSKPRFRLELLSGPTLCTTFLTGERKNNFDVHRTAISLYLRIVNIGSAPSSIEKISAGYHWDIRPISINWIRYRLFWFWLEEPSIILDEFQYDLGDKIRMYPSLLQSNPMLGILVDSYLQVGQSKNGVVYFEQRDSWGGCFPKPVAGQTRIRVVVTDTSGRRHKNTFSVPVRSLDDAKKFNPSFGATIAAIRGNRPSDLSQ